MVERLKRLSLGIFYGLLAYMPLHIFLSTWLGTSFDVLGFAKVFKDIVMMIGFLAALAASIRQSWFKHLLNDRLAWLVLGFAALNVILAFFRPTDSDAEILGLVYNTRFLLFFVYAVLLSKLYAGQDIWRRALRIVMAVATFVLFFGIVQYTILPNDALTHVGYQRSNGVLPAFFIDDKPDLERVMSTLRDPNSFGSYIIIIGSIALAFFIRTRNLQLRKVAAWLFALSVLSLWYTFSRSAWVGFGLAAVTVVGVVFKKLVVSEKVRNRILIGVAVFVVIFATGLFTMRNSYFVQNVIFHADEATVLEDPNQLRVRFWQESVDDVASNPLGHGPGTAGLASIRNDKQGVTLNENYYLQIAHELGVLGLLFFLAIIYFVGTRLYLLKNKNTLALGLLASFAGLALTNFLVHIWANEAIAYTWWGLAGTCYFGNQASQRLRSNNHNHHDQHH